MKTLTNFARLSPLALLMLVGCSATNSVVKQPDVIIVEAEEEPAASFPIEKVDFSPNTWVYRNPVKSPLEYAQVILSPVKVYENMASEVNKRDRRNLEDVGVSFSRRLQRLLEKDYMPVTRPGPTALRIEIQLLELKPGTHIFQARREKMKLPKNVSGTKLEAACYDSVSGELIFAVTTFYDGDQYAAYKSPVLITNLRGAFGEWSTHFKKRFDQEMTFN